MKHFNVPVICPGVQFEMWQEGETYFDAVATLHDSLSDGTLRVDFVRMDLTPDQTSIIDELDRKRRLEIKIRSLRQYILVVGDIPKLVEQSKEQLEEVTRDLEGVIEGIEVKMTTLRDAAV
ncbi:hypothetical protein [Paenibacillus sp. P46E]|uniref:hypothetical protein n=1 Tax=Paenibacillus sp. P46E TaxID=1349436 RepID=UPI00093E2CEA|nr:hypothetical protein [Paenibacillus sp. P46E]OKP95096.1 hypothetical protein A3849_27855 [Paenibacillus sp. P46E]